MLIDARQTRLYRSADILVLSGCDRREFGVRDSLIHVLLSWRNCQVCCNGKRKDDNTTREPAKRVSPNEQRRLARWPPPLAPSHNSTHDILSSMCYHARTSMCTSSLVSPSVMGWLMHCGAPCADTWRRRRIEGGKWKPGRWLQNAQRIWAPVSIFSDRYTHGWLRW